jgi:GT2 family glycosyltransferase
MVTNSTIVIPVYGNYNLLTNLLHSIKASTFEQESRIILWFDGKFESEEISANYQFAIEGLKIELHGTKANKGYVSSVNEAMKLVRTPFAFVLNSDIEVFGNWQQEITKAFDAYPCVATVSTLTNAGSILSTPIRNTNIVPFPSVAMRETYAELVKQVSKQRTPIIVTPVGHLFAVNMVAWREIGGFSHDFSPGYGEEVDFGERAIAFGYKNVLTDSVWVSHKNGSSFGSSGEVREMRVKHDQLIHEKHPTFLHRSSLEATSKDSTLAACLDDIQKHLLFGQIISDAKFFQSKGYSELQSYITMLYFPEVGSFIELISRDLEESNGGFYFNESCSTMFISNVEKLYNPFSNISDQVFSRNLGLFTSAIKATNFVVLQSESELDALLGMFDLSVSMTFLLPKSDLKLSEISFNQIMYKSQRKGRPDEFLRVGYYEPCAHRCESKWCYHVVSKILLARSAKLEHSLRAKSYEVIGYYGPKLSKIKKLVSGKRTERLLIPLGSKRRNLLKILIHKVVRLYQQGLRK